LSPDDPSGTAKHSPARLSTYRETHESRMDGFVVSGFVAEHDLEFAFEGSGVLKIEGEISCLGNIVIRVEKDLAVLEESSPDPLVQTFLYSYNASVRGADNFLRYDNLHIQEGHKDSHHKHAFDWRNGEELSYSPRWVGMAGWPTLSDFMEEVIGWYYRNREDLPNPDSYGEIGVRA
jgi:hypothetical protein